MPTNTANHVGRKVQSGLVATGSSQATALALINNSDNQIITTAASTGVILPVAKDPSSVTIWNGGANSLSVYPPVGGKINDGTLNAAYSLATVNGTTFVSIDGLTWYATGGAASGGGTVTSIVAGTGLSGGTITATGTISLAAIATGTFLANTSGISAAPTALAIAGLNLGVTSAFASRNLQM